METNEADEGASSESQRIEEGDKVQDRTQSSTVESSPLCSGQRVADEKQKDTVPKESEFRSWARANKLTEETIQKLVEHGLDDTEILVEAEEDDLTDLGIKRGQIVQLRKAVKSLKPDDRDGFRQWLEGEQIKPSTIEAMYKMEFDSFKMFKLMTRDDIEMLDISHGQKRALTELVGNLTSDKFREWLEEQHVKPSTIDAMYKMEFDSHKMFEFMTREDVAQLNVSILQTRLLESLLSPNKQGATNRPPPYQATQVAQPMGHDISVDLNDKHSTVVDTVHNRQSHSSQKASRPKAEPDEKTSFGKVVDLETRGLAFLKGQGVTEKIKKVGQENGMDIMKLPIKVTYEDKKSKIRRCMIGNSGLKDQQRTIMMVGATGAGKSTLIDGFCNYIFDVKWEENQRLKLIDEHADEKKDKSKGQSLSQTDFITVYTATCGESNRLPYSLNLIDTPGFGDTRGMSRDSEWVDQIRALFSNPKHIGIDSLDAVCFLAKAPEARLTHTQRYIFDSILAVFGHDIKENIIVMVTFADGTKPPVIDAIKAAEFYHRKIFKFNNSALFANNGHGKGATGDSEDSDGNDFSKLFWDMGVKSFSLFFQFLTELNSKSLTLTKEVLEQRHNLKDTLHYLEAKVRKGLTTMSCLRNEEEVLEKNRQKIQENKDRNTGYYLENEEVEVCKQYSDKLREYEKATGLIKGQIDVVHMIKAEYRQLQFDVENDTEKCRTILQRLSEIALKPDPLSEVEYIDMLIQAERNEHKKGYEARISELQTFKDKAQRMRDVIANKTLLQKARVEL